MELYRLKTFAAIAREGNLTRAADHLHLSQSAVSSQLRLLEEELGLFLFRRTPRGMELSEGGRQLLPLVEEILEAAGKLSRRASALRSEEGETLNIGLNTDPSFLQAGAVNRRMALLLENVNVVFHSCTSVRAARQLRQGLLDLAFFYGDIAESDIRCKRLADVRFCIVIPTAMTGAKSAGWKEVAALPWVWVEEDSAPYQAVQAELERRRLVPSKAVKTVDEYIVKELVVDGQGVAVMREDEARPLAEAEKVQLWEKGWLHVPLNLAWMEKEEDRKTTRLAREAIVHVWRQEAPVEGADANQYWY